MFMKTKKALAALLAVCMLAGMLPAAAVAAETATAESRTAASKYSICYDYYDENGLYDIDMASAEGALGEQLTFESFPALRTFGGVEHQLLEVLPAEGIVLDESNAQKITLRYGPKLPEIALPEIALPDDSLLAPEAEESASIKVREYHVLYASLGAIRDYCATTTEESFQENCSGIRLSFQDGFSVWSGANAVEKHWSATVAPKNHQPDDLVSVTFNFGSKSFVLPVELLTVTGYDKEIGFDFAEISLKPVTPDPIVYHSVTFDPAFEGAAPSLVSVEDGLCVDTPEAPLRDGYSFDGWKLRNAADLFDFTTPITGDITLYARWTKEQVLPKTCTVSFDAMYPVGGSKIIYTATVDAESVLPSEQRPENPSYEGYDFLGWFLKDANESFSFGNTKITEDITLFGHWSRKAPPQPVLHSVTFLMNYPDHGSGASYPALTVKHGETAAAPVPPTYEGYTFKGWFDDLTADIGSPFLFTTPIERDLVLTARWSVIPVDPTPVDSGFALTHAFYLDNVLVKEIVETKKAPLSSQIDPLEAKLRYPEFRGNTYTYTSADPANGFKLDSTGKQTLTLRYDFTTPETGAIMLTYSYVTDGVKDAVPAPAGVNLPKKLVAEKSFLFAEPVYPTYGSGDYDESVYTFHGWYRDKACTDLIGTREIVGASMTVYGYWTGPAPIVPDPDPTPTPKPDPEPQPEPQPQPDQGNYYRVTVRYLEEGSQAVLAAEVSSNRILQGGRYDMSRDTALAIPGYVISSVEGEVAGNLNGDHSITVWYAPETTILEPETPLTDLPELPAALPETPAEVLPQVPAQPDTPTEATSASAVDAATQTILVDERVPLGNLPQTGTLAAPVSPLWTLGLMALLGSMVAAGLAALILRKHEDDAE